MPILMWISKFIFSEINISRCKDRILYLTMLLYIYIICHCVYSITTWSRVSLHYIWNSALDIVYCTVYNVLDYIYVVHTQKYDHVSW